ncbi:MAG: PD-(D/E)XK nuclease family protein [Crocinitomicaceae bacterium]|nr:PD-(D/E)XK nuclease family protein [Crocinitomicaceae bacterium]
MSFIEKVAKHIHKSEQALEHLTIVLPSERAKKYLASALFKEYKRPIIAPAMITMDQWVKSYSEFNVIDKTRSLIRLFEIQLKEAKTEEDRSFDEFLSWGTTLLSDFDEIDRYMLEYTQIFKNLASIKEIEQWSFGEEILTESQKRFMEFWDRLPGYYIELNKALSENDNCYAGKAFRHLASNIQLLFEKDKEQRFLFAGFNALSTAELYIIRQLEKMGRAEILINADAYYYNNKQHEAGRFLRNLSTGLSGKQLSFVEDKISTKGLNIEMIECAQNTGQVKVASTLLESWTVEQINETLVLLADESLIGSVLKNLPKKVGKANITLGLPIRNTALRTWVELLFSIQENKRRFKTKSIYFNDLQNFWNHPFLLAVISDQEKKQLIYVEQKVIRQNKIFLNPQNLDLGERTKELLLLVTEDWESNWLLAVQKVREMNKVIYKKLEETFAFEKAVLESFDKSLVDFENIAAEGLPEMSLKSFKQLFNQHWGKKSIAYHGNPTDGLQIMGLLETRGLDFKRIICLGMNEGQLPPTNPIQTLIPMDLRRVFGLPTPREKQGLFAHHFYRLMHNCEELFVTYCSADESIGSNEPSRYLMQLEMELSRMNSNVSITKRIYALDEEKNTIPREILKTPEIQQRLDELLEKSTSASMLKKYLTCPLDFYFRYVMDFGEEESVEEEIENSTFGTFIHDTLEELYTPFARIDAEGNERNPAPSNITSLDIERMLKDFKLVLHLKFMEHFNHNEESFTKGKNLLSYQMAIELTERFLKSEIAFISQQTELVFIEALEQEYSQVVEVEVHGELKKVNLRGFIDRIDRVGDEIRIIDYKSGKVKEGDVEFRAKDVDEETIVESLAAKKHLLQLIQYGYLYHQKHDIFAKSSIISFISGNNEPFTLDTKKMDVNEVIESYPMYIAKILEEMYDSEIPFEHNSGQHFSYCNYCE